MKHKILGLELPIIETKIISFDFDEESPAFNQGGDKKLAFRKIWLSQMISLSFEGGDVHGDINDSFAYVATVNQYGQVISRVQNINTPGDADYLTPYSFDFHLNILPNDAYGDPYTLIFLKTYSDECISGQILADNPTNAGLAGYEYIKQLFGDDHGCQLVGVISKEDILITAENWGDQ